MFCGVLVVDLIKKRLSSRRVVSLHYWETFFLLYFSRVFLELSYVNQLVWLFFSLSQPVLLRNAAHIHVRSGRAVLDYCAVDLSNRPD